MKGRFMKINKNIITVFFALSIIIWSNLKAESIEIEPYARITSNCSSPVDFTLMRLLPSGYPINTPLTCTIRGTSGRYLYYTLYINNENELTTFGSFDEIVDDVHVYADHPGSPFLIVLPDVILGEQIMCNLHFRGSIQGDARTSIWPYPIKDFDESGHELYLTVYGNEYDSKRSYSVQAKGLKEGNKYELVTTCGDYSESHVLWANKKGEIYQYLQNFKRDLNEFYSDHYLLISLQGEGVNLFLEHGLTDVFPEHY